MATDFDWKRFWCPRGETFSLADRGFLFDPTTEYGKLLNQNLVSFDQLASVPCLALLGEPGVGKSWALRNSTTAPENCAADRGAKAVYVDLRSFGSEDHLIDALFESREWEKWRAGSYGLELFLDSLDECLLRIDNVGVLLADELPKQPVERLRLRIACRTAVWPEVLGNALQELYGNDSFKAYELVPLRRIDVQHAAEKSGVPNPRDFLTRIDGLDVASLAIKPVTLRFLIEKYVRTGDFPANHIDLYETGCRILCEESNESRLGSGRHGHLSADERLAIASRIAAVTQLANRYAVWTGNEAGRVPSEDVLIREIVGGTESGPDEISVTTDSIRKVLDTGLFSSRGPHRIGWAHQTYAEYLAARYCVQRRMPAQQLRALLFHPADGGRRLVPQLHELAAWASVMEPTILPIVAESDPEALLGAAAASLSEGQRQLVTQSIMDQCDAGLRLDLRWSFYHVSRKLKHSALADQLRSYVLSSHKSPSARHVAITIIRYCEVEELAEGLAEIALNIEEDAYLRAHAAAVVAEIGSADVRQRLRPLASGEAGDDPDDELKGSALKALWPGLITIGDLLPLITLPKRINLVGTYSVFLDSSFVQALNTVDLPTVLRWSTEQRLTDLSPGPIGRVTDAILLRAWENFEHPGVAQGLGAAALSKIKSCDSLTSRFDRSRLRELVRTDHERRRRLFSEIAPQLSSQDYAAVLSLGIPLLVREDFDWLLQGVVSRSIQVQAKIGAMLILALADSGDSGQMRKLWYACESDEFLKSECRYFFGPIALGSEEARYLREDLRLRQEAEQPSNSGPPLTERIERDLRAVEEGSVAAWAQLAYDLGLEANGARVALEIETDDLTGMPGWREADSRTRERILNAAFRFLIEGEPQNDRWFGSRSTPYQAIAGFQALVTLLHSAESQLSLLSPEVWSKWVPILLVSPLRNPHNSNLHQELLHRAYARVPDELTNRVMQLIDRENQQDGYLFAIDEVECCWDDRIAQALFAKVSDRRLKPRIVRDLLGLLIRRDVPGAVDLAKSFFCLPPPAPGSDLERMAAALEALILNSVDAAWEIVWPVIEQNSQVGRAVIASVSYADPSRGGFIRKLSEQRLGQLYIWMVRNYPVMDRTGVAGAMGPEDTAMMLRDGILEHLKQRGTFAASDAIRNAMQSLPDHTWLRHHLSEAEALARAASWQPISVRHLLDLAFDSRKRLIENGEQLIEAVIESLNALQLKLRDELPVVRDLWNGRDGLFWPKDEKELSDYVARHLREDLVTRCVIVNREVEIRRGIGDGSGQRTDIHIDAVLPNSQSDIREQVHVITEVKGNWNSELLTAMESQLRNRYLKDNKYKYGIYLTGWFSCAKWDDADIKKSRCLNLSLSEIKAALDQQARELSSDGYSIRSYVLDVSLT